MKYARASLCGYIGPPRIGEPAGALLAGSAHAALVAEKEHDPPGQSCDCCERRELPDERLLG
eukprot:759456-Heterocapsa_arctica.AAC.1